MSNTLPESIGNLNVNTSNKGASKIDPMTIPGFIPSTSADARGYTVHYKKVDVDDPVSLSELENLETLAIRDEGVYILSSERFFFMDKIFLLVKYLKKNS